MVQIYFCCVYDFFLFCTYQIGKKMGNGSTGNNGFTHVNIDSDNKQFFYTSFYDSNTGKEPIVMPCMRVYNYDLSTMEYDDYCFNGHDFRNSSNVCDGDVADSRALYIGNYKVNGSNYLYYIGRSDGGDTMYFCQSQKPINMNQKINMTSIDSYTNPYNMNGAAPISFIAQMDIKTGLINYGQLQNTRLNSGKANGLQTSKLTVDKYGYVYEQQSASCCIDNRGNLTINNEKVGNYSGGDGLLLVLSPDFKQRIFWTPFSAYNGGGKTKVIDIKVNNGRVVFALMGNGAMITKNPFSGTKPSTNGTFIGYIAIFPTVANQ